MGKPLPGHLSMNCQAGGELSTPWMPCGLDAKQD